MAINSLRSEVSEENKLQPIDRSIHDWYRFILSFPPHLVRTYINLFDLNSTNYVLDPFCGTGTTLVECKKNGISSIGIESNPMACFASRVKIDWSVEPDAFIEHAQIVAELTLKKLKKEGFEDFFCDLPLFCAEENSSDKLRTLPMDAYKLLLGNSISPLPLHKVLVLLETLNECHDVRYDVYEKLALAKALVNGISNLSFGPEVGVGSIKKDTPVIEPWMNCIRSMACDLRAITNIGAESMVIQGDSRIIGNFIKPKSVDAVITSPPYPNEKDYTRTTRLELVLLGFIHNKRDLRSIKMGLLRSNTRNVYQEDNDDVFVSEHIEIQRIADAIEKRRIELGKTSGFERLYSRVTKLYFGGMARHLADLRTVLRPGAKLAYVVGDQASYLRVMIRTGQLLADIAGCLGYEVMGIDLFRTRLATATGEQLREEVVLLKWPGETAGKVNT